MGCGQWRLGGGNNEIRQAFATWTIYCIASQGKLPHQLAYARVSVPRGGNLWK